MGNPHHDNVCEAMAAPAWQPIATAPKDRSAILLYEDEAVGLGVFVGYWTGFNGFQPLTSSSWDAQPSHWMPLPAPPAAHVEARS